MVWHSKFAHHWTSKILIQYNKDTFDPFYECHHCYKIQWLAKWNFFMSCNFFIIEWWFMSNEKAFRYGNAFYDSANSLCQCLILDNAEFLVLLCTLPVYCTFLQMVHTWFLRLHWIYFHNEKNAFKAIDNFAPTCPIIDSIIQNDIIYFYRTQCIKSKNQR